MKSRNSSTNAESEARVVFQPDIAENKNAPSREEIRKRAFEIHERRGIHGCDVDDYLDDWRQAERELREKYKRSNDVGARTK